MANTLTDLIPDAYRALNVVSRELVGFIPAVQLDPSADMIADGQTIRIPAAPANSAGGDITPAMSLPSAADQTISNKEHTLQKKRFFPFSWNGEQSFAMDRGPGYLSLQQQQIAQAMRAAVNEIETDIGVAVKNGASRAYGTAGTTPFASSLVDTAEVLKILKDNGAPTDNDLHLIINTTAGAKLRTLTQLTKVNEAGESGLLRQGTLMNVHGFSIRESAKVSSATAGTGASYQLNGAHSAGATTITVDTGSGTILAGDVVTINSVKYVVASALSGGSFTIGAPGLLAAGADNDAVTVNATSARNAAFTRDAVVLSTRLPKAPAEGDLALDRQVITDPVSGISFEIAAYPGFRMVTYHLSICWGVTVIKPEHLAILLG